MRVISQDGTVDVPYERYTVFIYKDEYLNIYHIACDCGEPSCRRIAKYSTEEKAKKAMEKLRETYTNRNTVASIYHSNFDPPKVFQFPKEEELE